MKNSTKLSVTITERDRLILRCLTDFGYLTTSLLKTNVFKSSAQNVSVRMKKLTSLRLVKKIYRRTVEKQAAFIPNLKGLRSFSDSHAEVRCEKSCRAMPWFRSQSLHEDVVRHIGLLIYSSNKSCEINMDYMQSDCTRFISDPTEKGVLRLPDLEVNMFSGASCLIEVELTQKSRIRIFRKLKALLLDQPRPVLYIVRDQKLRAVFDEEIQKVEIYSKERGRDLKSKAQLFVLDQPNLPSEIAIFLEQAEAKYRLKQVLLQKTTPSTRKEIEANALRT
jgi:hypothetical protein